MKKKWTAALLAGALAASLAVPASATEASTIKEESGNGDSQTTVQAMPNSVLYYGQVAGIGKDENGAMAYLVMESEAYGDYIMDLSDETVWIDSGTKKVSDPATLKVGEGIYVYHSAVATYSVPPRSVALAVVRNVPQDAGACHYLVVGDVTANGDGSIRFLTGDGSLYVSADSKTGLSSYTKGGKVALSDLKSGDRVMAWYDDVLESYPGQTYASHLMVLPALEEEPEVEEPLKEGASLTMELDGRVPNMVGRYESGTAMVPVAAVAQVLGFDVTYTRNDGKALVTVESGTFQVQLHIGQKEIVGVTKVPGAVGMTAPMDCGKAPYIVAPGTTWAPAQLFEMLGKTVTLEGSNLIIK